MEGNWPYHVSKKFGICKVKWIIDNICLQTLRKDWEIESPYFTVNGPEETRWNMILLPSSNINNDCVLFILKRSKFDSGPKSVRVNFNVYFSYSDTLITCNNIIDNNFCFKKGSDYTSWLRKMEYLYRETNLLKSDELKIVCEMVVYNKNVPQDFETCNNAGIKLLSENMLYLYTSGQHCDVELILKDNVIQGHRIILAARNALLESLIEDEMDEEAEECEEYISIYLPEVDYKSMKKILKYLYSGDIKHVLREPSYSIYNCACILSIREIEDCYQPDEFTLRSSVDVEQFRWTLFTTYFNTICGHIQFYFHINEGCPLKTLNLYFYPVNQASSKRVCLLVKTFDVPVNACVEIAVVDEFGDFIYAKKQQISCHKACEIVNSNSWSFLNRNYSSGTIFKLIINLKISMDIKQSCITFHRNNFINLLDEDVHFWAFSRDLESAFDEGLYSDVKIHNYGVLFSAHKCIISSRSRFLDNIVIHLEEGELINLRNIDAFILSIILTYIYTGILQDVHVDDELIAVYKAAVMFNMPLLQTLCSDRIRLCLNANRTIWCRVIKIAEKNKDLVLKESVLNCLFNTMPHFIPNHRNSCLNAYMCPFC